MKMIIMDDVKEYLAVRNKHALKVYPEMTLSC